MTRASGSVQDKSPKTLRRKRVTRCNTLMEPMVPVLGTFHHFPRLPCELREMIWLFAIPPRLITWHHSHLPPVLHACHESRCLWLKKHKIENWRTNIFSHETLYIDYSSDIMYFEGVMPGWKQWTDIPTKIEAPAGPPLYLPARIRYDDHDPCQKKWLGEVQRLAMTAEVAMKEFSVTPQPPPNVWSPHYPHSEQVNPWTRLNTLCPNLTEIIVVFGGGLDRESVIEEWVEIGRRRIQVEPWNWRWEVPNFRARTYVASPLKRVKEVEVTFVKARNNPMPKEVPIDSSARK